MSAKGMGALPLAALVASGMFGCGGSKSSTSSSAAPAPSTTPASSSTPAPPSGAGLTAPGTKLATGKTAIVGYKPTGDYSNSPAKQRLQITVTSIVKGTLADFSGIKLDAAQKASTPFYVKVRLTNVGPGDVAAGTNDPSVDIEGLDSTGQTQQSVTFLGDFPRCNATSPVRPMTHGKSFATCLTFLVPGGITAAAYTGTSDYVNSPVTWR
jgi:hypothetical protein